MGSMVAGQADSGTLQPLSYRKRIVATMDKFFMTIPDKWLAYDSHQKVG